MSAVLSQPSTAQTDVAARLAFQKQLQAVTNKIHATNNIDEIMLEVSADICALFNADRLTIYSVGEDRQAIVSKVKTGLNSFKDLKLPIAEHSIAGYVALAKRTVNLKDVYDDGELRALNANLRFLQEVDKRTGYRTKQMLVAPIVERSGEHTSELQSRRDLVCRLLLEKKKHELPVTTSLGRGRGGDQIVRVHQERRHAGNLRVRPEQCLRQFSGVACQVRKRRALHLIP